MHHSITPNSMVTELYTTTTPSTPWRTFVACGLLLVATSALAWRMSAERERQPLLAREAPEGWTISYQVPRRFRPEQPSLTPQGPAYLYYSQLPGGGQAKLLILRTPSGVPATSQQVAMEVANDILNAGDQTTPGSVVSQTERPLGPFPGVELGLDKPMALIRAAKVSDQDAYVMVLIVYAPEWPPALNRLFEAACQSVLPQTVS